MRGTSASARGPPVPPRPSWRPPRPAPAPAPPPVTRRWSPDPAAGGGDTREDAAAAAGPAASPGPHHAFGEDLQAAPHLRAASGRRAAHPGAAPHQDPGDNRAVQGREAAAGPGQNQVPGARPREHERAHQDHQKASSAQRQPGLLPLGEWPQHGERVHAHLGGVREREGPGRLPVHGVRLPGDLRNQAVCVGLQQPSPG